METIGATNQKPAEAIGELVANCFDARAGEEAMNILVDMRHESIAVIDNGKGMTDKVLEKAVCIAEDMSKYIERGAGAKGHFGMGFKTSCSTLGRFYEIFTRPIGSNVEYHTSFDISSYSKRPSGADAWDVTIEDKTVDGTGPLGSADHGTAFVVTRLKDKNITVSAVLSYLGEAFKGHLETGDHIVVVDDQGVHEARPKQHTFIPGSRIDIDTTFGPNDSYRITGWMALDEQTHNNGLYGFNIYRNKQLIEKWDKSWFRAHLMTSRIIGEVNMDFLDATFYKQGLQQSELWAIASAHMKEYLKPLVAASNAISKKGNINKPTERKKIVSKLRDGYDEDPLPIDGSDSDENTDEESHRKSQQSHITERIKNVVNERSLVLDSFGEINITYLEKATGGNVRAPFDYIFDDDIEDGEKAELQVIVFKDHPLWEKRIDTEVMKILATSDAIYRMLVEKLDIDASEALRIRNEWILKRTWGENN
jgi:hypothetical protein